MEPGVAEQVSCGNGTKKTLAINNAEGAGAANCVGVTANGTQETLAFEKAGFEILAELRSS